MIKGTVFLITFICVIKLGYSQNKIGIEVGSSSSNLRENGHQYAESVINFYGGATFEYLFTDNFSFRSGFAFERKGNKFKYIIETNPLDPFLIEEKEVKNKLDYLTITLLLKYTTKGKVQFFINIGPHVNLLTGSKGKLVKDIDAGVTSGLGIQLNGLKNDFHVEFRNCLGLFNINDSKLLPEGNLKTNAYYILLGYSYAL